MCEFKQFLIMKIAMIHKDLSSSNKFILRFYNKSYYKKNYNYICRRIKRWL